jgi:hypothetical protein
MESTVFFLVLAPVILFLILWFETKQNRKMNKVLKDTKNIQPLYLMRSVEQKINDLNTMLYGNTAISVAGNYKGQPQLNEGARQLLTEELNKLSIEFNNNKITLKEYNIKLSQLIQTAEEIRFVNFEQIRSTLS